jgi:hypothetical protein
VTAVLAVASRRGDPMGSVAYRTCCCMNTDLCSAIKPSTINSNGSNNLPCTLWTVYSFWVGTAFVVENERRNIKCETISQK